MRAEFPFRALSTVEDEFRGLVVGQPSLPARFVGRQPDCLALGAAGDDGDTFDVHRSRRT
jgi:hypothetical protein